MVGRTHHEPYHKLLGIGAGNPYPTTPPPTTVTNTTPTGRGETNHAMSMLKPLPQPIATAIRARGGTIKPAGDQWMVSCPSHDDSTPSLAIKHGDNGGVILYDHGGCTTADIVAAWGLSIADIMPPDSTPKPAATPHTDTWTPEGPASDIYDYTDEHGELLYQVMRVPKPGGKKTFRQRRPDTTTRTGWAWNLKGVRRVPYRLPETLEAIQTGKTVWICEGERDVHTLETLGHTATCNSGGANKWDPEFCDWFADGARVIIIADADQPGREHARKIYHQMQEVGANVTLTEPAEGCKDITDHLNAGLPIGDLLVIDQPPVPDYGLIDIHTLVAEEEEPYHWLIPDLLEHNERLMITGGEGSGKMVGLSTRILTPTGWTTMGDIRVGDLVIDRDGNPTTVTWKSDVQHVEAHRVEFNDGTVILACADHQWITQTVSEREREKKYAARAVKRAARVAAGLPAVAPRGKDQTHLHAPTEGIRTTRQIMDTLVSTRKNRATNHTIKAVAPLNLPHVDLPIDPYTLGVWLGDGSSSGAQFTLNLDDADYIVKMIEANGYTIGARQQQHRADGTPKHCETINIKGLRTHLRTVGLLGNKHIPPAYLRASTEQRLALLQGLMDTDGYAPGPTDTGRRGDPGGNYEIIVSTKYGPLGDNVMELLRTLGIIPRRSMKTPTINGEEHASVHRIAFQTTMPVFTVPRKSTRMRSPRTDQTTNHYITNITNTGVLTPMQCIQTGTHTYTVEHIPTHNSTMLRQIAIMTSAGVHPFPHTADRTVRTFDPKKVLWVDAENSRRQNRRHLTPLYHLTQSLGQQIPPGYFTIALRPEGLDLHKGDDHVWLQERVAITKPDLLIIGPWYRLFNGDPNDETAARQVIQVIDTLRAQYNFTTIMEAHSPHQQQGAKHRPLRPIGSSILLRWPEYGYGLQFHTNPDTQQTDRSYADFIPWRGDRDERSWPAAFTRGTLDGDPPWMATDPKTADDPRPERDHQTRRDTRYAYTQGNGGNRYDIKPRMADQ